MVGHLLHIGMFFFPYIAGYATGILSLSTERNIAPGEGLIWLDNVVCLGNENSISECFHQEWGYQDHCNHQKDVAIRCSGESLFFVPQDIGLFMMWCGTV